MRPAKKSKPTPPSRLERHRAEMRRRGFKLVQLWVPDPNAPGFREAVAATRRFLETHPDASWDALVKRQLDDAPEWDEA